MAAWDAVSTVLSAKGSGGWREGTGHLLAISHLGKAFNCSEVILE